MFPQLGTRKAAVLSPKVWPDFGDDVPLSRVIAANSGIGFTRWGGNATYGGTNVIGVGSDGYYSITAASGNNRRLGVLGGAYPAAIGGPMAGSVYDQDIEFTWQLDATPVTQYVDWYLCGRMEHTDNDFYAVTTRINTDNTMTLAITKKVAAAQTSLVSPTASGVTFAANTDIKTRAQFFGQGTVTIRGKLWLASDPEPATWLVSTTDTSHVIPAGLGFNFFHNTGATGTRTGKWKNWRQVTRRISY